jgi:hypothetical protein
LLYTALAGSRVIEGVEGLEQGGSRPALLVAVLSTNLGLMLLPPLLSLLLLAGVLR